MPAAPAFTGIRQEWKEALESGSSPSGSRTYEIVTGTPLYSQITAESDLRAYLVGAGEDVYGNLPLSSISLERQKASGIFIAEVKYGMRQVPEDGKFDFTMDSRPEGQRSFIALSTVDTFAAPNNAVPNNNGIVTPNADILPQGADVYRPVKTFNVSVWWSLTRFVAGQPLPEYQTLQAYIDMLETLEGCVNSEYFDFTARGLVFKFQTGEALLAGTRLTQQGADLWQIDLEIKKKKNYVEPNLSAWFGSDVTVEGWDRLEVVSEPYEDTASTSIGVRPKGGRIERDYFRADLNQLKVPAP